MDVRIKMLDDATVGFSESQMLDFYQGLACALMAGVDRKRLQQSIQIALHKPTFAEEPDPATVTNQQPRRESWPHFWRF